MITVGIDIGALNAKAVVMKDGTIISWATLTTGDEGAVAAQKVFQTALENVQISAKDIDRIASTGYGKEAVLFAQRQVPEMACQAKGSRWFLSSGKTFIDIGAETSRAIRLDGRGRVVDFAVNDKCASGTGIFLESMAKALEVPLADMGRLASLSKGPVAISSMCAVFAESEIVSHIHQKVSKSDILAGIHQAVAQRVLGLLDKIGIEADVGISGGVARNTGVVKAIEERTGLSIFVPEEPQIVGAVGCALVAAEVAS
jgi:predicted CoA-substrate-specific enzyme activase